MFPFNPDVRRCREALSRMCSCTEVRFRSTCLKHSRVSVFNAFYVQAVAKGIRGDARPSPPVAERSTDRRLSQITAFSADVGPEKGPRFEKNARALSTGSCRHDVRHDPQSLSLRTYSALRSIATLFVTSGGSIS